jgi:hypothetical protein
MSVLTRRNPGRESDEAADRDRLSVPGGLAALSLDAMASVAIFVLSVLAVVAHAPRRDTDAVVCRLRFRLDDEPAGVSGHNA